MSNRLKAYVRRTILASATEAAWPAKRRTAETTKVAFMDAMRGTDTGWWSDLIYTAPMLEMAHKYRRDIGQALEEYKDATGEDYTYRDYTSDTEVWASRILSALLRRKAWTFEEYREGAEGLGPEAALIGLRFAVEWYAGEVANDIGVEV
jgi:hypothetical protein